MGLIRARTKAALAAKAAKAERTGEIAYGSASPRTARMWRRTRPIGYDSNACWRYRISGPKRAPMSIS